MERERQGERLILFQTFHKFCNNQQLSDINIPLFVMLKSIKNSQFYNLTTFGPISSKEM